MESEPGKVDRLDAAARRWNLTPKQVEVLGLLAHGLSNRSIAAALGCAGSTVELHVTALLRKTHCRGRAALVARYWTDM
ncbi:MAG TPA: helix-turn-helix transcriptional regulator [Mycobacterium sp.]|nr:helix-turn-helix transcriptional regulator [Mycobacterium sp.]HET7786901.1 helix-turn-helix transcriptional regulator [Myxococcales bacterium]